jgi:hypothetical protein
VALAWLLTQYLRHLNDSVDLWHSMREYWHIGSCRECDQCNKDSIDKLKLVQTLFGRKELARGDDLNPCRVPAGKTRAAD